MIELFIWFISGIVGIVLYIIGRYFDSTKKGIWKSDLIPILLIGVGGCGSLFVMMIYLFLQTVEHIEETDEKLW